LVLKLFARDPGRSFYRGYESKRPEPII